MEGFLVFQFASRHEEGRQRIARWIKEGKMKYKEDVVEGIENAPAAFIGMMNGENFGKLLIKVSDGVIEDNCTKAVWYTPPNER